MKILIPVLALLLVSCGDSRENVPVDDAAVENPELAECDEMATPTGDCLETYDTYDNGVKP